MAKPIFSKLNLIILIYFFAIFIYLSFNLSSQDELTDSNFRIAKSDNILTQSNQIADNKIITSDQIITSPDSDNVSNQNLSTDTVDKDESDNINTPTIAGTTVINNNENDPPSSDYYLVTRVIDGDTIELASGETVRYIGIDTPETVHPSKPVGCYGREASNKNKELVLNQKVRLESDITDRDKYNRMLRYVFLEDGTFINYELVSGGFATNYTYPPDVKYQDQFLVAEGQARKDNRGLWSADCSKPCDIKGNISTNGEKIYHMPSQEYYNKTSIDESKGEKWFCSEDEATSAGWRKSKI